MTNDKLKARKKCNVCGALCPCATRTCACGHVFFVRDDKGTRHFLADGRTIYWKGKSR